MSLTPGKKPTAPAYGNITPYSPKDSVNNLTAIRTGITIAEILGVLVSVLTLGTGTPLAVGVEVGIGLAAGTANQVLDNSSGQGSVGGAFLNFAPALIPAITAPIGNVFKTGRVLKAAGEYEKQFGNLSAKELANKNIPEFIRNASTESKNIINSGQTLGQRLSGSALRQPKTNIIATIKKLNHDISKEVAKAAKVEAQSELAKTVNMVRDLEKGLGLSTSSKFVDNAARDIKGISNENQELTKQIFRSLSIIKEFEGETIFESVLNGDGSISDLLSRLVKLDGFVDEDITRLFKEFEIEMQLIKTVEREITNEMEAAVLISIIRKEENLNVFAKYYEQAGKKNRLIE